MKLTFLGTGSASVTNCYNTCFIFSENNEHFMVDAGGGNQILNQIENIGLRVTDIHNIFITHSHTDHILGAVWLVRMIGQAINYDKCPDIFHIYCHDEAVQALKTICFATLPPKVTRHFDGQIKLHTVEDGDVYNIIGSDIEFFDIHSDKTKQFGFIMNYNNQRLVCCGDEPIVESVFDKAQHCDWLMHEAFCLYSERDIFKPYEKFHSTVKEACEAAQSLNVKNLILYHTEDTHIHNRKELYSMEGKKYFLGNLFIPDELETIMI